MSVPIMATSMFQTAHSLTNMFWLSWLGEGYVAAVGLVSQFIWMSMAFILMCRMGAEISVSQNIGKGDLDTAKAYAQNGFMLSIIVGVLFTAIVVVFRVQLLWLFNIENAYVSHIAQQYMAVAALSIPFNFGHFVITGIYSGYGNTKLPFYINSAALILNIVLSPILIFGLGMGIMGAAVSLLAAAVFNFAIKIWAMTKYKNRPFEHYSILIKIASDKVKQILKLGVPIAAESFLFTFLFMLMTRIIAGFGYGAVAAHQVGMQVESLSFMIGGGFASALTAFIGQNYGAKKWGRMRSTFRVAYIFMGIYGVLITVVLFLGARPFVSIFLSDLESIRIAASYLQIIALAQLLFCLEGVAVGSFRGRGLTIKPSIASVSSNVLRVIVCYVLAATALGVTGIWWGIVVAMTIRSGWLLIWHWVNVKGLPKVDEVVSRQ